MVIATVLFALAAILGHAGYVDGEIGTSALVPVLRAIASGGDEKARAEAG
jgi:hypothetical protein